MIRRELTVPQRVQNKLPMMVHHCLQHCVSTYLTDHCLPMSDVPGCHKPWQARGIISYLFHMFVAAPLEAVLFQSPDQQSGIHCQIVCQIQLLTPEFYAELENTFIHQTFWSFGALEVLYKSTCTYKFTLY